MVREESGTNEIGTPPDGRSRRNNGRLLARVGIVRRRSRVPERRRDESLLETTPERSENYGER